MTAACGCSAERRLDLGVEGFESVVEDKDAVGQLGDDARR
jgi:hypothetical protein